MSAPATLVALLHGPDQPGLVARVAGWIFERGGNILHADQHRDMELGIFFQRIEWEPCFAEASQGTPSDVRTPVASAGEFLKFAESLGMKASVLSSTQRARVALFVSKAEHCF